MIMTIIEMTMKTMIIMTMTTTMIMKIMDRLGKRGSMELVLKLRAMEELKRRELF